MKTQSMEKKLELIRDLQNKYNDLYLGGSIALLMYGISLGRPARAIGDIDFNKRIDDFDMTGFENRREDDTEDDRDSMEMTYLLTHACGNVDIEINENCGYNSIVYKGHKYRLASVHVIIGKKLKYALKGSTKHIEDVKYLLSLSPIAIDWDI